MTLGKREVKDWSCMSTEADTGKYQKHANEHEHTSANVRQLVIETLPEAKSHAVPRQRSE